MSSNTQHALSHAFLLQLLVSLWGKRGAVGRWWVTVLECVRVPAVPLFSSAAARTRDARAARQVWKCEEEDAGNREKKNPAGAESDGGEQEERD